MNKNKTTCKKQDKKNIIVFGGAGFIGSHLCEELVKTDNVICVDTFVTSSVENIRFLLQKPNFEFIKHDISEPLELERMPELKKFQVDIFGIQEIYNLACPTSAKNFDSLIVDTVKANSIVIKNILDMALKYDAQLVHGSSAVVYGPRENNVHFDESHNGLVDFTNPRACYDEGKRFAETMITTYNQFHKKNFKIARIFRTYGPRLMLNDGQMISDFILNSIDNKDLVIYGDEKFSTALCYVNDIVDGLTRLMKSNLSGAVNLGTNVDILLSDVANQIITMAGSKSNVVYADRLHFITQLGLPDIRLAKSKLGWYPLTTLDRGLKKTLDYTRAHKQLLTGNVE